MLASIRKCKKMQLEIAFHFPYLFYCGHADKIKCQGNDVNQAEKQVMQGRVRACHKMLMGRLKNWGILSQVFRHHISMHGNVFQVCAVLTQQLTIENGELLFEVECED
jgi:hypothetical protein